MQEYKIFELHDYLSQCQNQRKPIGILVTCKNESFV